MQAPGRLNLLSVKIDIAESAEELLELLEQETDERKCQKLRTLYFLRTQKVKNVRHIAQIFKLHRTTVGGWLKLYRQGGLENLLRNGNAERLTSAKIPDSLINSIVTKFKHSPVLPSADVVKAWVKEELEIEISRNKAYRIICEELAPVWQADNSTCNAEVGASKSIQETVSSKVYKRFEYWQGERRFLNTSSALEQLIGEFFGIRSACCLLSKEHINYTLIESIAKRSLKTCVTHTIPDLLSQNRLAERLGIHNSVLSRNRNSRTFSGWTKQYDPDNVGWQWVPHLKKYKALIYSRDCP